MVQGYEKSYQSIARYIQRINPPRMCCHLDEHLAGLHVKHSQMSISIRRDYQAFPQSQRRAGFTVNNFVSQHVGLILYNRETYQTQTPHHTSTVLFTKPRATGSSIHSYVRSSKILPG